MTSDAILRVCSLAALSLWCGIHAIPYRLFRRSRYQPQRHKDTEPNRSLSLCLCGEHEDSCYVVFFSSTSRRALRVLPPTLNLTNRKPRLSYGYSVALSSVFLTACPSSIPRTSRIVFRSPVVKSFCSFASATYFAND